MNKESLIAIALGLILGILVAVGAVYYTVHVQRQQNSELSDADNPDRITPTAVPPTIVVMPSIELQTPSSGSVTDGNTIKIAGTAATNALIIIQSPIRTQVAKLDTGTFSFDFPLALGENVITISSYPAHSSVPVQKHLFIYRII